METPTNNQPKSIHIELFIAHLLRWGVAISFLIVAVGIFLVLTSQQTGYQSIRLDDLNSIIRYQNGPPEYPNSINDVVSGALALKPYAFIALGLIILIAIPVMRVAISVLAFFIERDWVYVIVTAFVLAMLLFSLVFGVSGG
jgi:uncharacterized membrane protein